MNLQGLILTEQEQAELLPMLGINALTAEPSVLQPIFSDNEHHVREHHFRPADFDTRSPIQKELFELDPTFDLYRNHYLKLLPPKIADFLAHKIKTRIVKYDAGYANAWLNEQKSAIRERLNLVMNQYCEAIQLMDLPDYHLSKISALPFNEDLWKPRDKYESEEAFEARKRAKIAEGAQYLQPISERLKQAQKQLNSRKITPLWKMNDVQLKQFATIFTDFLIRELNDECDKVLPTIQNEEEAFIAMHGIYQALVHKVKPYPFTFPAPKTSEGMISALKKITDDKTWYSQLKRLAKRAREHMAIAVGMVHSALGGYVSNERLCEFEAQKSANLKFLKSCVIINTLNEEEQHELLEIWLKSNANPKLARIELMTRLRGYEETADVLNHQGVFVTLTAPSKYHAMHKQGGYNDKWNGASPKQTQRYLCNVWAKIRASLKRQDIQIYGLRVAEPHHDATPHFHFVLWTTADKMRDLKRTIYRYALEEDGSEAGAKRRRCTFKMIDRQKGSATAYIAKYISKNIDALGLDDLLSDETGKPAKEASARAKAWSSLWGIRQFQFIGGAGVSVYRELRRLGENQVENACVENLRIASDMGEYACYLRDQGGIFAPRKMQTLRPAYMETEPNKYEEIRKKIMGVKVQVTGEIVKTRLKEWTISKKRREWYEQEAKAQEAKAYAQEVEQIEKAGISALGLVSVTVRGEKMNNISPAKREAIKQQIIIQKGRVTEYQIDDLLNGKSLRIGTYQGVLLSLRYVNGQLIEEKQPVSDFY